MGKKPFSAKAKREQLRQKRLASASGPPTPTSTQQSLPSAPSTNAPPPAAPATPPRRTRSSRAPRRSNTQRYRLQLGDADTTRSQERQLAHKPLNSTPVCETSVRDVRPYPDSRFAMPRRPAWRYEDSVAVLEKRETAAFDAWLAIVEASDERSAYFEHNLETWRQLWRVIERSDVLILVADIRFPALHFVPDLYHYVNDQLGKGVVLALNKCDLVPAHLLHAWRKYFREKYPDLAIAMFSSFPDAKLAPSQDNSELLSKRERRMARSKLSAWGADQLLTAIDSLRLDPKKRGFLEEWRAKLGDDASSDEDEDIADVNYLEKALRESEAGGLERDPALMTNKGDHVPQKVQRRRRRRAKGKCAAPSQPLLLSDSEKDDDRITETDSQSSEVKLEVEEESVRENMITIGVVGHPNAGKSSMINGIFRKKVVSTSRTPGHTKHLQTIFLSDSVRLCDCPGLVFPGLVSRELQILAGMYPISQVREPYAAVKYLAERVPLVDILKLETETERLEEFTQENAYLQSGWTAWKICEAWAMKRGFRTARAARLDVFRAANNILRLALDGRIVLATVPRGYVMPDESEADFASQTWKAEDGPSTGDDVTGAYTGNSTGENEGDRALESDSDQSDGESENDMVSDRKFGFSGVENVFCLLEEEG